MYKFTPVSIIMLAFLLIYGCYHDPLVSPEEEVSNEPNDEFLMNDCDEDTVYFENDILPFIITACGRSTVCHEQNIENKIVTNVYHNYLKQKFVPFKSSESKLYTHLITDDPEILMPRNYDTDIPYNAPQEKIDMIKKWIDQGALKNGCRNCDSENFTYTNKINLIVLQNCANSKDCHGKGSNEITLIDYENLKKVVDNGLFEQLVLEDKQMPKEGSLSDCDLFAIDNWLKNDAKYE